jgi:hypothetical protein
MLHAQLAALALATTALAAAGCGSTSKPSSTGGSVGASTTTAATTATTTVRSSTRTRPLTRAQLIAQADVICRKVNARRSKMKIKTSQDYARSVPPFASYEQVMYAKLDKLVPPASMAKDWTQIVAQARTLAAGMTKIGQYAKTKDLEAANGVFSSASKAQAQMIVIAKLDGFKDCSRPG